VGDGDYAECRRLPGNCSIQFGDGDVEALAELVFHGADDLTAILERLGVLDAKLEGELGDWHGGAKRLAAF
jgi:hypothetical protein